ncbi:MAG: hypothetical protein IT169_19980 [Bryobacterales bacterium]|nr:hypothetical protein [Bryobacterales bacterium]
MRSNRSISLPLAFAATCCLWFVFLWTMQHAPSGHRPASSGDFTGSRSSGGLANTFATAVVKFFDTEDPREVSGDATPAEPFFDAEMVEYLPLPKANRVELSKELPEVFDDPSLTPRNLFRSDVDLDGDHDLDLALLVRLSKTEALGAVLEYLGEDRFRLAGKFHCRYERAEDFSKCFTIVLTGTGRMHTLSRTSDPDWSGPAKQQPSGNPAAGQPEQEARAAGWRWMRLEKGALAGYGTIEEPACAPSRGGSTAATASSTVAPVPGAAGDLLRFITPCGATPVCRVFRFDAAARRVEAVPAPPPEFCKE